MKLKLLLFFLLTLGYGAMVNAQTQKKPYNNFIITEALMSDPDINYVEFTNMGSETIDLSEFEFGALFAWDINFVPENGMYMRLPKKTLAPGKSFLICAGYDYNPRMWAKDSLSLHYRERVQKPEMEKLADLVLHQAEYHGDKTDSVSPNSGIMQLLNGQGVWYLRHHFINDAGAIDSMIIDQVNGIYTQTNGESDRKATDVAGVVNASENSVLIRRNSVKTGINEFSSHDANLAAAKHEFDNNRGLDLGDSEWIPIYQLGFPDWGQRPWRAVFWTAGNQVNATLDANTLVPKSSSKVKVDLAQGIITIPWGIRYNDSIMYQFVRKPGLAWGYDIPRTKEDSAYISARTGDVLTVYACGDVVTTKKFTINVTPPTADDNIVIPKNGYNYLHKQYGNATTSPTPYSGYRVSNGVKGMDSIKFIAYATRIDTLYKYLEKAPDASWKIVFKDGIAKPDLKNGDVLRVTSKSGKSKDYFLKLEKPVVSENAYLASITWPDIPASFKGDIARLYGWKGDTIPGFTPYQYNYVVKIPLQYSGIPALVCSQQQLASKIVFSRAKTLNGTPADRTVTITVTAEDNITKQVYTVRFDQEKDPANIQPWFGEPFFSRYVFQDQWANNELEIANPGTEPLDLSGYIICAGYGTPNEVLLQNINADSWLNAYTRYVPGKKWQDQQTWLAQPAILESDLATNPIVAPGDVFLLADINGTWVNDATHGNGDVMFRKEIDFDFEKNSLGRNCKMNALSTFWGAGAIYLYKITSDSVKNGIKAATDLGDFKLIDCWAPTPGDGNIKLGGVDTQQTQSSVRKPEIYKPNPKLGGSNGTTPENCEWTWTTMGSWSNLGFGWPDNILKICEGLGFHTMNDVTIYRSTVTSNLYIVSLGYSKKETIRGLTTGTTVSGFYNNIIKANALQTLKVKSAKTGLIIPDANAISKGDSLIVLSADSTNTSKYILDVTANGLSNNATLTSTNYTITVNGATGTVGGFPQGTLLKTVVSGVTVPAGATLTLTDANDAYMSLTKLNYDTAYVNVLATDAVYFKVVAENGVNEVSYQLQPTSNPSDAYVTSDVYSVDQVGSLIQFIPNGTTVFTLIGNLTPASGATMTVYDKAGFVRNDGTIYRDDKLTVTSSDGKATKTYYFSMLNFHLNTYFAYVISDNYQINQVTFNIAGPRTNTSLAEFEANLYPSFGASLQVLDKNGMVITGNLTKGSTLLVTAADGQTTATYNIDVQFPDVAIVPIDESIKMYPNPTMDKVIINGLSKGNRVQVLNSVGVTLRHVIVTNSTEHVSLSEQPAGIYIFIVSSGNQRLNIQKIIKK